MATELDRVRELVAPIASDLELDLYDVERRSNVLRITIDTPPGSPAGIDLDTLSLATRLMSRELDHEDPIASSYTLEVTSPGLERRLRTPAHFRREVGKEVTVRLAGHAVTDGETRRIDGTLVAADDTTATIASPDGAERTIRIDGVDKARTVVDWSPKPKPGKGPAHSKKPAQNQSPPSSSRSATNNTNKSKKEKHES